MAKEIYVGNLPWSVTSEDLKVLFSEFGDVTNAIVMTTTDERTGRLRSRGFGFVTMTDGAQAEQAITKYNGFTMEGRDLVVNEARPREARPAFGGGDRGGFRGGDRGGDRGGFRGGDRGGYNGGNAGAFAPQTHAD